MAGIQANRTYGLIDHNNNTITTEPYYATDPTFDPAAFCHPGAYRLWRRRWGEITGILQPCLINSSFFSCTQLCRRLIGRAIIYSGVIYTCIFGCAQFGCTIIHSSLIYRCQQLQCCGDSAQPEYDQRVAR